MRGIYQFKPTPLAALVGATIVCVATWGTSGAEVQTTAASMDVNASCRIPFEKLRDPRTGEFFPLAAAFNDNNKLAEHLRGRYIVADLNTTDADGYCRGVREYFSAPEDLSDFARLRAIAAARNTSVISLANENSASLLAAAQERTEPAALLLELEDLRNYLEQVHRFRSDPIEKPPVFNGYCVGQTLSFCEIVNGEPKLVYRFVTSSSRAVPPPNRYYAPINFINTRHWSSNRRYGAEDARRDARLGGGDGIPIPFENGGNPIEMPNFMNFLPLPGYTGERANGIHEIAGGLDSGGTFGAPVSLGCIRLNKFQAMLARWWTPREAKFFVYFEPERYRHFGDPVTGKARAQQVAINASSPAAVPWPEPQGRRFPQPQLPVFPLFGLFALRDQ
ncbi:MAG TPA: hypothetical protein VNL39_00645 [Xanthobacteraceae bacterium]|nr:hypothetical protein [Xanthobacteraceae bacterium]